MGWDREAAEKALVKARACRDQITSRQDAPKDQYIACIHIYQSVYRLDPHFGGSDDAVYEEGQVFHLLAERAGESTYLARAAKLYQLLVSEYPTSPRCPEALLRLSDLYSGPLKAPAAAMAADKLLKTRYKSSAAAAAALKRGPVTPPAAPEPTPPVSASSRTEPVVPAKNPSAAVQNIRYWSTKDYTRVIIDLDGETPYQKTRILNPARVFFDIKNARVTSDLFNKNFSVSDEFLRQIRVAQNRAAVVRVVLDLADASDCIVTEMHNPFRIVIDVHGAKGPLPRTEQTVARGAPRAEDLPRTGLGSDQQAAASIGGLRPARLPEPKPLKSTPEPIPATSPPLLTGRLAVEELESESGPAAKPSAALPGRVDKAAPAVSDASGSASTGDAVSAFVSSPPVPIASPAAPASGRANAAPHPVSVSKEQVRTSLPVRNADVPPPPVVPPDSAAMPRPASPTSVGNRTMTRMLGLKIGRIVIDPGHGGHDTGTIGRGGLREKDVVLEVALQLRSLLEEKLGAEVILTRDTDMFIPLEDRTALANERKADLFVSIHANSASNRNTSGVETYYLNFARSAEDREIAARENAASARNIHELQDLVKKIAQAEKSAESRELAAILQKKLYTGIQQLFPSARNRGVRSAPFVVLIGAHMPSVLAEVAFMSNPRDERLLKKEDSAQRVARALFSGIEGYTKTLGGDVAQSQSQSK